MNFCLSFLCHREHCLNFSWAMQKRLLAFVIKYNYNMLVFICRARQEEMMKSKCETQSSLIRPRRSSSLWAAASKAGIASSEMSGRSPRELHLVMLSKYNVHQVHYKNTKNFTVTCLGQNKLQMSM